MRRAPRRDAAVALALAFTTFGLLVFTSGAVGIPRDESVYFDAGHRHAQWARQLLERPAQALGDEAIARHFEINREHPALPKLLFGLSHALFTEQLGWTGHRLGFRLPAFAFSALLVAFTFLLGARLASPWVGLFAALGAAFAPRHFLHLHLASFDVPAAATWVLTTWTWLRALEAGSPRARRRWAVATGLAFGLAVSVKHNAYFLPLLLATHWGLCLGPEAWRATAGAPLPARLWGLLRAAPGALWAMALLGPLCLYLLWPFLWHHPLERFSWYLAFHLHHEHYPWHYLGELLRAPPFPLAYPFTLSALTLPLPLLVPGVWGFFAEAATWLRGALGRWRPGAAPLSPEATRAHLRRGLLLACALFPPLLIALPSVPIFGGVKHWMHSAPYLLILGGAALAEAAHQVGAWLDARWPQGPALARLAPPLALALCLTPLALWTPHFHPHGTSAYSALAGGAPGAASLGMQRQYWSHALVEVLPFVNAEAPRGGAVYLHEVTWMAYRWYQREGLLRADLRWAHGPAEADLAVYQHHQEFRDREYEIMSALGAPRPAHTFALDGVPLLQVYLRPRR